MKKQIKQMKEQKQQTKGKGQLFQLKPEMPVWTLVVDDVVNKLEEASKEYDEQRKAEEYRFELNTSNILGVYGRLTELYALGSIAFDPKVGWFGADQTVTPSGVVDGS